MVRRRGDRRCRLGVSAVRGRRIRKRLAVARQITPVGGRRAAPAGLRVPRGRGHLLDPQSGRRPQVCRAASSPTCARSHGSQFETIVGEAFRRTGYTVLETGQGGADGGVDLVLSKGGQRYLVQCKQYRASTVGETTVREIYGVVAAQRAAGAIVVTTGSFTKDAMTFAVNQPIELIDGRSSRRWCA